jgi:hypothetical protein
MPSSFELGNCYITPGAASCLAALSIAPATLLQRHASMDWVELSHEDKRANEQALHDGSRLLSSYVYSGHRIWVITEAADDDGNRAATTILLASEY